MCLQEGREWEVLSSRVGRCITRLVNSPRDRGMGPSGVGVDSCLAR